MRNKPVSLIDLYPTLADLRQLSGNPSGNPANRVFDGESLVPLLKPPTHEDWKKRPVLTAIQNSIRFERTEDIHFSLVDDKYRYTLCSDGKEELYDHEEDPNEWIYLAGNADFFEIKRDPIRR